MPALFYAIARPSPCSETQRRDPDRGRHLRALQQRLGRSSSAMTAGIYLTISVAPRGQLDDPAVSRGMIDEQAALLHHVFALAQTQRRHTRTHSSIIANGNRSRLITLLALHLSSAGFATTHPSFV
jgi:hypothetical protein